MSRQTFQRTGAEKPSVTRLPIAGVVDSGTGKITFAESWARAVQAQRKHPYKFKGGGR